MVQSFSNCNFMALGGIDPHNRADSRYQEYREAWNMRPEQFYPGNFPVHLDIEVSNRCNLRCTFCDKLPYLNSAEMGDMDYELYTRIIDEGIDCGLYSVKLSYRGEPLLHKRIAEMVHYAKEKGVVDIYFNTNGMLLTEAKSQALIEAGLDRISISAEGIDSKAYEESRVGANFEKIKENAARLMTLRNSLGVSHPKVRIQTVAFPYINLDEYARYWEDFCDETAAIDYKEAGENAQEGLVDKDWACPQPWQRMTIEWDGTIHPCNNDDQGKAILGKAGEISLQECWVSQDVEMLRACHKRGDSHTIEACSICPWRTTQILKKESHD